jgi:hypothetical protein
MLYFLYLKRKIQSIKNNQVFFWYNIERVTMGESDEQFL